MHRIRDCFWRSAYSTCRPAGPPANFGDVRALHVEYAEAYHTVVYSELARFMNTVTLNMNLFLSNTGFTRRNMVFKFLWLRPRNT